LGSVAPVTVASTGLLDRAVCQSHISDDSSTTVGDERAEFLEFPKIPDVLLKRIRQICRQANLNLSSGHFRR